MSLPGRLQGSTLLAAALVGAIVLGCAQGPERAASPEQRASRVQNLLVRGVAHAEVGQWSEAIRHFEDALELGGEDPVLRFNLGVAHLRNSEPETARRNLDSMGSGVPDALAARAEYARGKIALEDGDVAGEAAAYRRAMELDPSEPAYPFALAQVLPRSGRPGDDAPGRAQEEIGSLLQRSVELWPGNSRLRAELAQWALLEPGSEARARGLELVSALAEGNPEIEPLLERGRAELAQDLDRASISLRRALNLLRPGKRFQTDSAALEARLALVPLPELLAPDLGRERLAAPVAIQLEQRALLPETPFAADERVLDVVAFNDVGEPPAGSAREAHLAMLTDRGLWVLEQDRASYERLAGLSGQRRILVGELDGDGLMEILILGEEGVSAFGRSEDAPWRRLPIDPGLASFDARRSGLLTDFEHDGDLDLLLIDAAGRLQLATHRGESGLGAPVPAPLPASVSTEETVAVVATDLDNDADQDLIVVGDGRASVLTNWRQGDYRTGQVLPFTGPPGEWVTGDLDADGRNDLVGTAGGQLLVWRNRGLAGLARDPAAEAKAFETPDPEIGEVRALRVVDLDRDAALDLLVAGETADGAGAFLAWRGDLEPIARLGELALRPDGLVAVDLDGDGDPDPLVWGSTGLASIESTGGEGRGRLELSLKGLKGKVPLDARGVRLETWLGLDRFAYELARPHLVVGLDGREPAVVKVTWPNGISEYLFAPEVDSAHLVEQELRIEGSCPFLYASDGLRMRFITDILGLAPLGMLATADRYVPADPEEYLRLPDWVSVEGTVEISITEELREVAYIDQSELVVVDAPPEVEVYNGERWFQGRVEGLDLRLLGPLEEPVSVRDARGREALDAVRALDHRYLAHSVGERLYQGARTPSHLEIEIPPRLARTGRASLVLIGWLHWGNTSTSVARGQDPRGAPVFPYLEVPAGDNGWRRVALDVGLPAGKTKPVVVDLTGQIDPADPRLRITTDFEVYWDRIAVAETLTLADTPHRIHRLAPSSAELAYGGFSRWYRPADDGPYLFDYADRRPYPSRPAPSGDRAIAWREHEGFYTRFGPVTDLVRSADDRLAVFGSGEELSLTFDAGSLPALPSGWRRALFLHSEGWEKDGDPNVACSQTVEPLPAREMQEHPCPQSPRAGEPPGIDRRDRWVDSRRLERRVLAWTTEVGR